MHFFAFCLMDYKILILDDWLHYFLNYDHNMFSTILNFVSETSSSTAGTPQVHKYTLSHLLKIRPKKIFERYYKLSVLSLANGKKKNETCFKSVGRELAVNKNGG